jgi:hypothetical protein
MVVTTREIVGKYQRFDGTRFLYVRFQVLTEPDGMQRRVVSLEWIDVSEVRTTSTIVLMMEAVRTTETSIYAETTRPYIPECPNLDIFFSFRTKLI